MADIIAGIAPRVDTHANWTSLNPTLGKDDSGKSYGQIIISTGAPEGDIMVWGNAQTYNVAYAAGQYFITGTASLDTLYPIGAQYIQYASVASNDPLIALPASEAPASLYGGTWEKLWDTESVYFRTEGTDADDGRVDGKQLDQMQMLTGDLEIAAREATTTGRSFQGSNGVFSDGPSRTWLRASANNVSTATPVLNFNSSDSPNARTSATTDGETRVTGRLMRIWKRTA